MKNSEMSEKDKLEIIIDYHDNELSKIYDELENIYENIDCLEQKYEKTNNFAKEIEDKIDRMRNELKILEGEQ